MSPDEPQGAVRFFLEGHVVQLAQAVAWAMAALLAFAGLWRRPAAIDRALAGWQGTLAVLALLRELDLHERLHAVSPVHFRTRWLLDPTVPWWWKAALLSAGVLLAAALLAPPVLWPVPWRPLLARRDRVVWLLVGAVACLGAGYVVDDFVARRRWFDRGALKMIEETLELAGAVAFWAAVAAERGCPISRRLGRGAGALPPGR